MSTEPEFIPFALPDIQDDDVEAVTSALRSGWVTTGPRTKEFEKVFSTFLGEGIECLAVNSATAGLHLALEAFGVGPGDEVITTTLTFTATAEVARYLGAEVRLVDVDRTTLLIDLDQVAAAITPRTRAIIPMHYGGLGCDIERLLAIARPKNIKVIEDAAHALPATVGGKLIGTFDSDATVFSFYANKTMTTGEGGMVATKDQKASQRMRIMRLHGISRDAFDRFVSRAPAWYYEVVAPGFKYNLTDIASALGISQLSKLPSFLLRREYIAVRYLNAFKDLPLLLPAIPRKGDVHAWHLFVVRLTDPTTSRDHFIQYLADQKIGTSVHYIPLHRQPYWRDLYGFSPSDFPVAEGAFQAMVTLPLYTAMTDLATERVINAVRGFFNYG